MNNMFTFTLNTKIKLVRGICLFDQLGNTIGRVLSKSPIFKDDYDEFEYSGNYCYQIESTKETFEKLECGEIQLNLKEYSVSSSNTYWVSKEQN